MAVNPERLRAFQNKWGEIIEELKGRYRHQETPDTDQAIDEAFQLGVSCNQDASRMAEEDIRERSQN